MNPRIYQARPFKVRNADEYDLSQVLNLFVSPFEGLANPFDFENTIIKGRMGSGKTMYLRANHAYYLYSIVPSLINNEEIILPVFIRLSDFQHISEPSEIYRGIIIKIIEELASIYIQLQDSKRMANIHLGMKSLPEDVFFSKKLSDAMHQLLRLGADEYVQQISSSLGLEGELKHAFITASAKFQSQQSLQIKQKANPGISDVASAFQNLIGNANGKVLLLIDEAGTLDKKFFKSRADGNSFFEILMNQFRTSNFIRTKIAIYPHSYSDILTETRYGDIFPLEENVIDEAGYKRLRRKTCAIISNYITATIGNFTEAKEIFSLSGNNEYGDCLEQLIFASGGNLRRLIQLLDAAMSQAYDEHEGKGKVELNHATAALVKHSEGNEHVYNEIEKEFLEKVAKACRSRRTFRFQFPNMTPVISKYTSRSQEYNLINIIDVGSGRRSTKYAFDYSYCVAHDIPTHYLFKTEKIDEARSLLKGRWITRLTTITDQIIQQSELPGKIEGDVEYIKENAGFIIGDDSIQYYFNTSFIIEQDQKRPIGIGKRTKFFPGKLNDSNVATNIEIL